MSVNEDVIVGETVQTPKISHSEGLKVVEITFQYFEQGTSIMVLLFLHQQHADYSKEGNRILRISLKKRSQFLQSRLLSFHYRQQQPIRFVVNDADCGAMGAWPSSRKSSREVEGWGREVGPPTGFSPPQLGWNRAKLHCHLYGAQQ
ncbi:hypothetical protein TNCV_3222941 [Trichonephila clavipes]|nr:hypothetical protein TNCV_3222941 [Trichonephila clavipes]